MYKKKIIGIALIAAMVSSMAAVSASARSSFDGDDTIDNYFENHTVGIVGSMTEWGTQPDVPMTDADGDGVYVGVYKDLAAGDYEFKVRADSDWNDAWGMYDEENDRTKNGFEDNLKVSPKGTTDLIVTLDTNGDDETLWPVAAFSTEEMTAETKYGIVGSITGWAPDSDIPMYEYETGKFVGIAKDLAAGDYEFKVRAFNDSAWSESYGVYDEENDRTKNGFEDNIKVELADASDIVVIFDTTGDEEEIWPVSYTVISNNEVVSAEYTGKVEGDEPVVIDEPTPSRYGIVGDMTGWGNVADFPMYETEKGIYVGVTSVLAAKEDNYMLKVRADSKWDESWGVYDEENDRTKNGFEDNILIKLEADAAIVVKLDTTGDEEEIWPLSYAIVTDPDAELQWIYTGKKVEEESKTEESKTEESKTEESKTEESKTEESKTDTSVPVDEPSKPEFYETKVTDYIYFDNSQTKWNEVYAYWWHTDYARTYDLENNDWGIQKKVNDDGTEGWEPVPFPGTKMTKIEGTDIWQVRVPFNAHKIIFNCGFTDDQIKGLDPVADPSVIVYQTKDISFDAAVNAGQIYVIDTKPTTEDPTDKKANPTPGRGQFKAKYTYNLGDWASYTEYAAAKGIEAKFMSEQIGEIPQTSTDDGTSTVVPEPSQQSQAQPSQQSQAQPSQQQSHTQPSSQNVPQNSTATPIGTGDATMPIAVAVVAALALGTALVTSRKKTEE